MYEKPQYLTPDGYKRSAGNPLKKKGVRRPPSAASPTTPNLPARTPASGKALRTVKKIDPDTARLIAKTLSGMLKSNRPQER